MITNKVVYNNEDLSDYDHIFSAEGAQQGDTLGSFIFALGAHPLFKALSELVGGDGFVKAYIDDCTSATSTDINIKIINYIREHGPKYGIFLNFEKTKILLGSYPNNVNQNQINKLKYEECLKDIDPEIVKNMFVEDGLVVLGCPIGKKPFIVNFLEEFKGKIEAEAKIITDFRDTQGQHLFFHYILKNKVNHILRTVRPEYTKPFMFDYDRILRDTFSLIMQIPIIEMDNYMWEQCKLSISSGGFGIDCHERIPDIAFTASAFGCVKDLNATFPFLSTNWSSGSTINWITQVKEAMGLLLI